MLLLVAGGQQLLPGWLPMFVNALRQYHQYTHNLSVLDADLGFLLGRIFAAFAFLASAWRLWPLRKEAAGGPGFGRALALTMALTVLIVPMIAPYNQVLLFPSVMSLARGGRASQPRLLRFAYVACTAALALPWLASLSLTAAYFVASPSLAMAGWKLPFLTTFSFPLLLFGLMIAQPRPSLAEQPSAL